MGIFIILLGIKNWEILFHKTLVASISCAKLLIYCFIMLFAVVKIVKIYLFVYFQTSVNRINITNISTNSTYFSVQKHFVYNRSPLQDYFTEI